MNARSRGIAIISIALLGTATCGCTTTRTLAHEPAAWESSLEHGDRVVIQKKVGRKEEVRFHGIADGKLYGERTGDTPTEYSVEISDIQSLEIREISAGKAVSNVLVGAVTVVGWILWAGLQSGAAGM